MRDILTALAGIVVLLLVAALAIPPLVAWEGQRGLIDRAVSRSLGLPARSQGRIEVRLLPSPRLRFDRLRLGDQPARPGLDLHFVKAEMALSPLLTGAVRFTETRIGRAELRLPVTEGEAILVPADLAAGLAGRDLAIEDLQVRQLLVTTQVPATGRTDQIYAESVRLSAPRLTGPWRAEGTSRGVPFRVSTGEPTPEGVLPVKLSAGGDTRPYAEIDAKLSLADAAGAAGPGERAVLPQAEGTARLVVGPPSQAAGAYLPVSLGGAFTARGAVARFKSLDLDIDPGGRALRLSGTGRVDLRNGRAALALGARRLDLDAFLLSPAGQAVLARGLPRAAIALPVSLDVELAVDSVALGLDDWSNLALAGTLERSGGLVLKRVSATAPGAATLSGSGEIDADPAPRFTGQLALDAPASDGFGRYLGKLGLEGPGIALMDGRPIRASADLSAAPLSVSLRNLRLELGPARITGNARYRAPEGGTRGRVDAQLAAQGIDIAALPSFSGALSDLQGHDLGLVLQARDVRYGPASSGNGTIAASIQSDGASLAIDSLDVTDLAGAQASLSGRIGADGAGRIAGRVSAPVAAPLLGLLDKVWIAEARLVPRAFREGALDLGVTLERDAGAADTLRTTAKGMAAGGSLDLDLVSRAGRIGQLDLTLATPSAATWFGRADGPAFAKPARLHLSGTRAAGAEGDGSGLALTVTGTVADLTLATTRPILLEAGSGLARAGEIRLGSADLAPFVRVLGGTASIAASLPADLTLGLSRTGDEAGVAVTGRLAGSPVSAAIAIAPGGEITGWASLSRLSVPALAAALVMPEGRPGTDAAFARFAAPPALRPRIVLALGVESLDLGRGFVATGTTLTARLEDGTLSLTDLAGTLEGGRLTGTATLSRQGGAASVAGEGTLSEAALAGLVGPGPGPISGRLGASLRFGTSGETPAALANHLGGSGSLTLAALTLPGSDPAGLARALDRVLAEDDPLREGRLQALVTEEFGAGPLTAPGPVTTPVTLVGGALRGGPLTLDLGPARWTGTLGLDLRSGRLDARGTLTAATAPKAWTGGAPAIQLGFSGPVATPERQIDAGPATNGLAALVLQRELESIELLDVDQTERLRRRARIEMDKARTTALKAAADKVLADKALADKVAAEEAARQARLRAEKAAAERAAEAARQARAAEDAARRQDTSEPPPAPQP